MRSCRGRHSSRRPSVSDPRQDAGGDTLAHTQTFLPSIIAPAVVPGSPHPALPRANRCRVHPYFPFLSETWRGTCPHLFLGWEEEGRENKTWKEASQSGFWKARRMVPSVVVVVAAATRPSSLRRWPGGRVRRSAVACTHHPLCRLPGLISWFGSNLTGCSRATVAFWSCLPWPCTSWTCRCACAALGSGCGCHVLRGK